MEKKDRTAVTAQNLKAWNEAAPLHAKHNQADLLEAFSVPGHSCLDDVMTNALRDLGIDGADVAQVCCNNGIELISACNLGAASCVGFDGASAFIAQAREIAAATNQDTEFVCCDAYALPEAYWGTFDIVMITIGVLSWMPDLPTFVAGVTKLLKPGGALLIYEHHPILEMLTPGGPGDPIDWELSYFSKEPFVEAEGLDYYGGEKYDATPVSSFMHPISETIMAGINAGLRVESLAEFPKHISNTWYNVEAANIGLPMSYTLVFRSA